MSETIRIRPRSGTAFLLSKGHLLKVSAPEGKQVADLLAYNSADTSEWLSNGKTFDYQESIHMTTGSVLYSNKSGKMLEILEDTCGTHDFLLAPCCNSTMEVFYDIHQVVPTCHKNLFNALKAYGIEEWSLPTAFNIFMNVRVEESGKLKVLPSGVQSDEHILFQAHQDLIIGLTACSAGITNGGDFKSISYQILTNTENGELV